MAWRARLMAVGAVTLACGRSGLEALDDLLPPGGADGGAAGGAASGGAPAVSGGPSEGGVPSVGASGGGAGSGLGGGATAGSSSPTGGASSGGLGGSGGSSEAGAADGGVGQAGTAEAGAGGCDGEACGGCPDGSYSTTNHGPCLPWSPCTPGRYVAQEPSSSHDRVCQLCPRGTTTHAVNAAACAPIRVTQMSASFYHSCARFDDGTARCWGLQGALGYGALLGPVGDDELPSSLGAIRVSNDVSITVMQVAAGVAHTCARLSDDTVKCWGAGNAGQLGLGSTDSVLEPSASPSIQLGNEPNDAIEQLVSGEVHSCVRLRSGKVRCWGHNSGGQLGLGHSNAIGNDEPPSLAADVSVSSEPGVTVTQLAAGAYYTCALLSSGAVKCWGENDSQQLGYGHTLSIGDDELPSSLPDVPVSSNPWIVATQVVTGYAHTCVLLSDATVKCWGRSAEDYDQPPPAQQTPGTLPTLPVGELGAPVVSLASGWFHTCALLANRAVKCWGNGASGQLGYADQKFVHLSGAGPVAVLADEDTSVAELVGGGHHTCAVLSDGKAKCWGLNIYGMLGQGHIQSLGDDEEPLTIGPIQFF